MAGYQVIDRKTWKRNMHCQIFQDSLELQYCISLELDITNFLKMVKGHNIWMNFPFLPCPGFLIHIYPIRFQVTGKNPLRCLTGGSLLNGKAE